MKKLLYVAANPKTESESFSLTAGRAFIDEFKKVSPDFIIEEINLFDMDLQDIDSDVLNGWAKLRSGKKATEIERKKIEMIDKITEQFMTADLYLFSSPLWNLSIPGRLKIYFDNVVIARKTITYQENGLPVGLMKNKKAFYIQAAGGFHSNEDALFKEYGAPYIEAISKFMGIDYTGTLYIEGMASRTANHQEIRERAISDAKEMARKFNKESVLI